METIYITISGNEYAAGDVEKGEFGGWVATAYGKNDNDSYESCYKHKREAVAWVKKKFKSQFK